jgi:hypothetical protein
MIDRYWAVRAAVGLLVVAAGPSRADSPPLTAEQVACEERQLERLQGRFAARFVNSSLFLWRSTSGGGRFEGLYVPQGINFGPEFSREEAQLSFEAYFKEEGFLLNPDRLPLSEVTLVRRDPESTTRLFSDEVPDVTFEAATGAPNPFFPRVPVDLSGRPAESSVTRVGRGPAEDDLLTPCFPGPTASDAKILHILARSLRPTCWTVGCPLSNWFYKVTILRSEAPYTFRANLYTYSAACADDDPPDAICRYVEAERIALEFHFEVSAGRLTTGTVRVLPDCTDGQFTGCTRPENITQIGIFILPPIWPEHEIQGPEALERGGQLVLRGAGSADNVLSANLDWAELLRDTAWNEAFE